MTYNPTETELKEMGFKEMTAWHGWEHNEHDISYFDRSDPEWHLYIRKISPTSKSDIETLIRILSP